MFLAAATSYEFTRLSLDELDKSPIDWTTYIQDRKVRLSSKKKLRDDQIDADAEFVREEQRKQEKRERGKRIYRRFNQTRRHEASEVPHMTDFLRPILQWASRKSGVFHRSEVLRAMANHFKLSPAARRERTREGNMLRYEDRGSRSLSHLKKAKLVRSVSQGYYEITEAGKKEAFASNERMTTTYLSDNFPAYRLWKEHKRK